MARNASEIRGGFGVQGVVAGVRRAWGESPLYQAQLKGPAPDRVLFQPQDPRPADKEIAQSLARGRLAIGSSAVDCEGDLDRIWDLSENNSAMSTYLQEFSWLRHLNGLGKQGTPIARKLTSAWLNRYEKWSADEWRPYFVSERLVQICAHHPLIMSGGDALWRSRVLNSMARQTRHLARSAHRSASGFDRLMTSLGLAIAGHCLPGCESAAERGIEMTRRELRLQLRPDGSHLSRNPSRQLKLALRMQMLVNAIEGRGLQPPPYLRHMLIRVSAMAMFFRCGDGHLAVFNGGYEDCARTIVQVQKSVDPEVSSTDFARHSGFQKLIAARSVLIVDGGDDNASKTSFRGTGSFHFSSGRSRIVTNCGNGAHRSDEWRSAMHKREAHSAISCREASSIEFGQITKSRAENTSGHLFEIEREIFTARTDNAKYTRRFFLNSNGSELLGEEILEECPSELVEEICWRFHLHPGVRASVARDQKSAILLLPNKEGWRFKSSCTSIHLEKTAYCGDGAAPVSSEQLVLRAKLVAKPMISKISVKWGFRRADSI